MRLVETSVSPVLIKNILTTVQCLKTPLQTWNNDKCQLLIPQPSFLGQQLKNCDSCCSSKSHRQDQIIFSVTTPCCCLSLFFLCTFFRGEMSRWGNVYARPHPAEPCSRMGHQSCTAMNSIPRSFPCWMLDWATLSPQCPTEKRIQLVVSGFCQFWMDLDSSFVAYRSFNKGGETWFHTFTGSEVHQKSLNIPKAKID